MTSPKDNDELRRELKDRIDRYFDCYLAEDGVLINDIMHLISTYVVRARIDERRQVYYVAHDILADTKIPRKEALKYFDERLAQLNHQKSQKEGE